MRLQVICWHPLLCPTTASGRERTSLHVLSICSVPGGLSPFLLLLFFALFSKHSLLPLIHKISWQHEEPSLAIVCFRHTVWSHSTVLTSAESCFPAWGGWPFRADVGDFGRKSGYHFPRVNTDHFVTCLGPLSSQSSLLLVSTGMMVFLPLLPISSILLSPSQFPLWLEGPGEWGEGDEMWVLPLLFHFFLLATVSITVGLAPGTLLCSTQHKCDLYWFVFILMDVSLHHQTVAPWGPGLCLFCCNDFTYCNSAGTMGLFNIINTDHLKMKVASSAITIFTIFSILFYSFSP